MSLDLPEHDQEWMRTEFPNISELQYRITSDKNIFYNCAAWAVGIEDRWVEPTNRPEASWPKDIDKEQTVATYTKLYKKFGYEVCDSPNIEPGYEKITLYVKNGYVMHVSKQLDAYGWTSKVGRGYDMRHDFDALVSVNYGSPKVFLRRKSEQLTTAAEIEW